MDRTGIDACIRDVFYVRFYPSPSTPAFFYPPPPVGWVDADKQAGRQAGTSMFCFIYPSRSIDAVKWEVAARWKVGWMDG